MLKYLSGNEYWEKTEKKLNGRTITAYELPTEAVRCDAAAISGHHEVAEEGLSQYGHSRDNPRLPQTKMMTGSPDPPGMPLAGGTVSGERERIVETGGRYLCPLPRIGTIPETSDRK